MSEWTFNFDATPPPATDPLLLHSTGEFNPFGAGTPEFMPALTFDDPSTRAAAAAGPNAWGSMLWKSDLNANAPTAAASTMATAPADASAAAAAAAAIDDPPPIVEPADADAHFQTARAFACGTGGKPIDFNRALEYYKIAAAGGHAHANWYLGYMYSGGCRRFPTNAENSATSDAYFLKAASLGHLLASASCHCIGRGPYKVNRPIARHLLRLALDRQPNDADAVNMYANYIDVGVFNPVNKAVADGCTEDGLDTRKRAAALGSEDALIDLGDSPFGSSFEAAEPEMDAKSVHYYQTAIDKFHSPYAMVQLAHAYLREYKRRQELANGSGGGGGGGADSKDLTSRGGPVDSFLFVMAEPNKAAVELLIRAAKLGRESAQKLLADIFDRGGYDLPANEPMAYACYGELMESSPAALYAVGMAQLNGWGTAPDPVSGVAKLKRVAGDTKLFDTLSRSDEHELYLRCNYLVAECDFNHVLESPAAAAAAPAVSERRGFDRVVQVVSSRVLDLGERDTVACFIMSKLAFCHAVGLGYNVSPRVAIENLIDLRQSKSNSVQRPITDFVLAELYLYGCGIIKPNFRTARNLYAASADFGFLPAIERLDWIVAMIEELDLFVGRDWTPWSDDEIQFTRAAARENAVAAAGGGAENDKTADAKSESESDSEAEDNAVDDAEDDGRMLETTGGLRPGSRFARSGRRITEDERRAAAQAFADVKAAMWQNHRYDPEPDQMADSDLELDLHDEAAAEAIEEAAAAAEAAAETEIRAAEPDG